MLMKYGVVQGRLLPQVGDFIQNFPPNWRDEFKIARDLGVSHIEWIDGAPNQLTSEDPSLYDAICNVELPKEGPMISGLCLDWLPSDHHTSYHDDIVDGLRLVSACTEVGRLGTNRLILPLLENASLAFIKEASPAHYAMVINSSKYVLDEFKDVILSFETDLDASGVVEFLNDLNDPRVRITFDTGNLTRAGYDLNKHLDAYGDKIDNVHIKDCTIGGKTVQLGTGHLDMRLMKRIVSLPNVEFLTFQTARSPGSEIETFRHNRMIMDQVCS